MKRYAMSTRRRQRNSVQLPQHGGIESTLSTRLDILFLFVALGQAPTRFPAVERAAAKDEGGTHSGRRAKAVPEEQGAEHEADDFAAGVSPGTKRLLWREESVIRMVGGSWSTVRVGGRA
jgi:hypothetical protein